MNSQFAVHYLSLPLYLSISLSLYLSISLSLSFTCSLFLYLYLSVSPYIPIYILQISSELAEEQLLFVNLSHLSESDVKQIEGEEGYPWNANESALPSFFSGSGGGAGGN